MYTCQVNQIRSISFSGIDGAGKTTQIRALCNRLKQEGLKVRLIAFWDEIATLTRIRETTGHKVFKGDKGFGTPNAPINRRDKNVQSRLMTCARLCLYFLDALSTRLMVRKAIRSDADFVIFDRYIYDELANLDLRNPAIRMYVRLIMKLVPRPQLSFLLDADPFQARARKPEYPLEFLCINSKSYLRLSHLIGGMTVITSMPVQEVERQIQEHALHDLSFGDIQSESNSRSAVEGSAYDPARPDRPQAHRVAD
jgi:thymidylate kinase